MAVVKVVDYSVADGYVPSPTVMEAITKTSSLLLGMEKPYSVMGGLVLFAGSLAHAYQALDNVTWYWG
jgi:hypothetical protein